MSATLSPRSLARLFAGFDVPVPDLEVTGLALDSRRVSAGDLFLAVRGHAGHGLRHVETAIERGAAAIAWEPAPGMAAPEVELPQFAVRELGLRVGELAARFHGAPSESLYVCGVTGTDGKTSTAHLMAQALEQLGEACTYLGTLGTGRIQALAAASHTTPDPVSLQALLAEARDSGIRAVSMEVSSHALHQNRVGGITFDAAILTNVQRDHLDYHGTVEAYAAAKRRFFEPADARLRVLNRDDARGAAWLAELAAAGVDASCLLAYGLEGEPPTDAQYVIGRELVLHGAGLRMRLDTSWGALQVETGLLGRFNAYNLMAVAAVLLHKGHAPNTVVRLLAGLHTVPGRIEGFRAAASGPLVVVDYAHTPQALEQILRAVRAHCRGTLSCVFGCGGDRDRGKRPLMAAAAAAGADRLIVTDDNPRSEDPAAIVADILTGIPSGRRHEVIHDRGAAIDAAIAAAGTDDVVVVAGKGHEDYQIYGAERRTFSDRAYVARRLGLERA
jgi:UDP-N-acetylmuramoyl-L-alanyl-D-glutamate--2,6-diaminopimelate ligase